MLTERELSILQYVKNNSKEFLIDLNLNILETDAKTIGLDLNIDRSNTSRILNDLYRAGYFIKISGRPTFFIDRDITKELFPNIFMPSIIKDIDEFLNYLQPNRDNTSEERLTLNANNSEIIGIKPNESLESVYKRMKIISSYPNHSYNILLEGNDFTGKETISNLLHNLCLSTGNYSEKMVILDFNSYIDDLDILRERTHQHLTKNVDERKINLILLKNIHKIPNKYAFDIYKLLSFLQSKESPVKRQYIATSNKQETESHFQQYFFSEKIKVPEFDNKTIKEKVEFILDFFQYEADQIQMSICISKNVLSCFVMAKFEYNLNSLQKEIKYAISNSFYRHIHTSSNMIDIDLDDLSDNLLNSILNVTNRLSKLEQIFDHIGDSNIYFIPENSSRERELLRKTHIDHQENITFNLDDLQKLSTVCKRNIHEYSNKKITTIRSIYIKDIYNILYPTITNFNPHIPDNIIFGLFMHLENTIKTIQDGNYRQSYYSDIENLSESIVSVEGKISQTVFEHFQISIPTVEKQYIRAYLDYAQAYSQEGNIGIVLISHSRDLEEAYKNYIHKNYKNIKINTLLTYENFRFSNQKVFLKAILDTIDKTNQGKGVVILTDVQMLMDYEEELKKQSSAEIVLLSPISIPLLTQVTNMVTRREVKLSDLASLHYKTNNKSDNFITHPNEMLHDFSNKILAETLIFLDPKKAVNILSHVMTNIYNDLNIPHDDSITIRFIHHCSFMIERVIRNEPLNYKNTKEIVFEYNKIFKSVEKNFQIVNNNFGINIPASEIALISNIFIEKNDLINTKKNK